MVRDRKNLADVNKCIAEARLRVAEQEARVVALSATVSRRKMPPNYCTRLRKLCA
jgi:hypothetical protein